MPGRVSALNRSRAMGACVLLGSLAGCERSPTPPAGAQHFNVQAPQVTEGEFLGSIYINGQKTTSTGHYVELSAFDPVTASRLRAPHNTITWADPDAGWMWEWFDPVAGGTCGELAPYLAGDTTARFSEAHRPGPGQPASNAKESHCIRPGTYSFEVAGKIFQLEYLQVARNVSGAVIFVSNFVEVFADGGALIAGGDGVQYPDGTCRPRPLDPKEHQVWLEGLFDKGLTVEHCKLDDAS